MFGKRVTKIHKMQCHATPMTSKKQKKTEKAKRVRSACGYCECIFRQCYWNISSNQLFCDSGAHFNAIKWGIHLFMRHCVHCGCAGWKIFLKSIKNLPFLAFHWNSLITNELMWTRAACSHFISLLMKILCRALTFDTSHSTQTHTTEKKNEIKRVAVVRIQMS